MSVYGRINGKGVLASGSIVLTGDEEFEFDYENVVFSIQFDKRDGSNKRPFGRKISDTKMKYFLGDNINTNGFTTTFEAGETEDALLLLRLFVHVASGEVATSRVVTYTLLSMPKAA